MIGTITRGYEASAREARIRPVSLLFMPSPYISERRSTWSTLNKRLSPYPEAKAVKHNPPRADEAHLPLSGDFTGTLIASPSCDRRNTRSLAGSVTLAFLDTTCGFLGDR